MRTRLLAAAVTLAVAGATIAAPAHAHVNGGLGFPDARQLRIELGKDGAATATVLVRNTATDAILPTFTAFVRNPGGAFVQLHGTVEHGAPVQADGAQRYHLRFSGSVEEGATGKLVAIGAGSPGTVDVRVSRASAAGIAVPVGLAAAVAIALLAAGAAALVARRPSPAH